MNRHVLKPALCTALVLFFTTINPVPVSAQTAANPSDSFYADALRWELLGLIDPLPPLRPYSLQKINAILDTVISGGNPAEAEKAHAYKTLIQEKPITVHFDVLDDLALSAQGGKNSVHLNPGANGDLFLEDYLALSYDISLEFTNNRVPSTPLYSGFFDDTTSDSAEIGTFSGFANVNTTLSAGGERFHFIGGVSRSGWGPFLDDSLTVSPKAFHAPFISYVYDSKTVNFTQSLYTVIPTNGTGGTDNSGKPKFIAFHSIELRLLPWFSFIYFEGDIWGGYFDPTKCLPVPYIVSESFSAYGDNVFMGVGATVRPCAGTAITGQLFVDDVNVNEIFKLNLDTRITLSGMLGVQYAPASSSWLSLAHASYTLVTPWMYSHSDGAATAATPNYQNFAHNGANLATQLDPNSHRLNIGATIEPKAVPGLKVKADVNLIQHGNISETLTEKEALYYLNSTDNYITNGTLQQHGSNSNGYLDSYLNKFQFLEQPTIMTVAQLTVDALYAIKLPYKIGLDFGIRYTFEYIHNDGVQRNIFYARGAGDPKRTAADVTNALNAWRSGITPHTFRNYLTLSARIRY